MIKFENLKQAAIAAKKENLSLRRSHAQKGIFPV